MSGQSGRQHIHTSKISCDGGRVPDGSQIKEALVRGRRSLYESFAEAAPLRLNAGDMFTAAGLESDRFYRLKSGWACQYQELCKGRRAIIDLYLPGDFIGLDASFNTRPVENVLALTSVDM